MKAADRLRVWIRDFGHEKQPVFICDLTEVLNQLEKFEPFGTGEPSALERTVESMEHAMIGWRWRALRAEKNLEEAYSIIQAMDAKVNICE